MKNMDCINPVNAFEWNGTVYKTREAALKQWALDYFDDFFREVLIANGYEGFDDHLLIQCIKSDNFKDAVEILQA